MIDMENSNNARDLAPMSGRLNLTNETASRGILAACDAGTLVQGQWHAREEGREIACLLGSMHPGVRSSEDCNGDLMPLWLAKLTPALFDGIAPEHIYSIARRYGGLVARWHVLKHEQWESLLTTFLVRTIDEAVDAARPVAGNMPYWSAVDDACAAVKEAIKSGDEIKKRMARSAAAASAYAAYAAFAAAAAAASAADAAYDAADAASRAASHAAHAAAAASASDAAAS